MNNSGLGERIEMKFIKNLICKNKLVQSIAVMIVRREHLLSDPDKYFSCAKREPNLSVFLDDKYLKNAKLVSSREKLLEYCEPDKVWAEVGRIFFR